MAPHSSTLAWKIPWTEEPGRLQSMGSPGVGHDLTDLVAAAAVSLLRPQSRRHSLLSSPSTQRLQGKLLTLWPHQVITPCSALIPRGPQPCHALCLHPHTGKQEPPHQETDTPHPSEEVSFRPQLNGDLVSDRAVTWSSGFPRASGHPSQGTVSMGLNPPHPVVSPWKS